MFHFMVLIAMAILSCNAVVSSYPIANPGCPEKCGNVSIYYPFGIGEGCFKDKWFEIACKSGPSGDSTPMLVSYELKVSRIFFHQVWVAYNWTFPSCYPDDSGMEMLVKHSIQSNGTYNPFLFSQTRNKLVGFGCGVIAYVTSKSAPDYTIYTKGCLSLCNNHTRLGLPHRVLTRNCLGIGCCQAMIPPGLKSLSLRIFNIGNGNHSSLCSRAFIVDENLRIRDFGDHEVPMVMSWIVGNSTCEQLRNNSDSSGFACGKNAHCQNYVSNGHRCKCNSGYEGNPYIAEGCQDIDECKDPGRCTGGAICQNVIGSFYCRCPAGNNVSSSDGSCVLYELSELIPKPKASTFRTIILGFATVITILSSALAIIWCAWMLKRKRRADLRKMFFKRNGGLLLQQQITSQDFVVKTQIFATEELERATDNFSQNRMCGKGGCGLVYKGMLSDGRIVAIKRSHVVHEKQVAQFINEVVILSGVNHRNVVKLLGCCLETEVPLLVYEFIGNGTLSQHIHGEEGAESSISWEIRVSIAREIAGALSYLHSSASTPVFHRDVKSSNILLDYNFNAKISDFGISRSIPIEKTHLTLTLQGTFGYLDPQYFRSKQFTDKSDVYSFGVVLAELLTGERAVSKNKSEVEEKSLVMNFTTAVKENRLFDVVEDRVRHEGGKEEIMDFARLAKQCIKLNGKKRPTMKEVAADLEKISKQIGRLS